VRGLCFDYIKSEIAGVSCCDGLGECNAELWSASGKGAHIPSLVFGNDAVKGLLKPENGCHELISWSRLSVISQKPLNFLADFGRLWPIEQLQELCMVAA